MGNNASLGSDATQAQPKLPSNSNSHSTAAGPSSTYSSRGNNLSPHLEPNAHATAMPSPHKQQSQAPSTTTSNSARPSYVLEKQTNSIKNQVHGAISKRDLKNLKRIVRLFRVDPNEELSVKGYFWTGLHYAAHFKAEDILEFMIKLVYRLNPDKFLDVVNVKTKEGWTPAMIACIYKSDKCLDILFKYGGVRLKLTDKHGRNLMELAKYYRAIECQALLAKVFDEYKDAETTPVNYQLLEKVESIDAFYNESQPDENEQKPVIDEKFIKKQRKLHLEGEPNPSVICLSQLGWIKYTDCCGQPLHQTCKGNKITTCPFCKKPGFLLISEVYYPERSFSIEDKH